jgi:hypothetical protein
MYLTRLKMILLSLIVVTTTSGCASLSLPFGKKEAPQPIPVEIKTVEVKIPIIHPTMPRAIDLKDPQWYVVSDKNIDVFLEDIKKQNAGGVVFIAMSIADYELMSYNMQELRRYINQMKEVVIYYRTMNSDDEEEVQEEKEEKK